MCTPPKASRAVLWRSDTSVFSVHVIRTVSNDTAYFYIGRELRRECNGFVARQIDMPETVKLIKKETGDN